MSETAPERSEPNYPAFVAIIAVPLALAFLAVYVLPYNPSFMGRSGEVRGQIVSVMFIGAIGVALVGMTIWSFVYRRVRLAVVVWGIIAICFLGGWLLLQLQYALVLSLT